MMAGPVLLAGLLAGAGPASAPAAAAAGCQGWTGLQPLNPGTTANALQAAAVLSACNAWAVGFSNNGGGQQPLIEHWNGSSWKVVPAPDTGGTSGSLASVRAVSASSVWAVGTYDTAMRRDRKSTRLNSSHYALSRMPSSA